MCYYVQGGRIIEINEFIKDVNRIKIKELKAYHHLNSIWVTYQSRTLLQVPFGAKTVFDCLIDNELNDLDVDIELQLNDKLNRFLRTPINERFPEKKYRLRWSDDSDCSKNYIGLHRPTENFPKFDWYMTSAIDNKLNNYQELWTESELEKLKKDNPRLAPAIDAMKEPVKTSIIVKGKNND